MVLSAVNSSSISIRDNFVLCSPYVERLSDVCILSYMLRESCYGVKSLLSAQHLPEAWAKCHLVEFLPSWFICDCDVASLVCIIQLNFLWILPCESFGNVTFSVIVSPFCGETSSHFSASF